MTDPADLINAEWRLRFEHLKEGVELMLDALDIQTNKHEQYTFSGLIIAGVYLADLCGIPLCGCEVAHTLDPEHARIHEETLTHARELLVTKRKLKALTNN